MGKVTKGLFWKLMERFGVQGIQFVLQIILARMLSPEHYGTLSLLIVFTTLANVFIQSGLNTALIQNKDVTDEDYSSVFWLSLGIAATLYGVIFVCAPMIADYYRMQDIVSPLRVLSLSLFPGALNSVQLAKISRELDFKKVFYGNISGIILAGIAGIAIAWMGGGLWALVVQNLLNITTACAVMFFTSRWRPQLVFNLKRVLVLFQFGWKLLVANLLSSVEASLYSLVIGKKYDSGTLGYYNRGFQFPQFVMNAVTGAMQSVLLPAMAAEQEDRETLKNMVKDGIRISCYVIFPMMGGLACVASPLIRLLLTEKWLPAVPYMQISCFCMAFYSVYTCNLQVINAVGRSDLFLQLEIIKKCYSFVILVLAVYLFDSPMAIAMTGVVTIGIDLYVNSYPNKKLIGYSYWEMLGDLLPLLLLTGAMCGCVLLVGYGCTQMALSDIVTMILQIITGVAVYVALSIIIKPYPYRRILETVAGIWKEKHS